MNGSFILHLGGIGISFSFKWWQFTVVLVQPKFVQCFLRGVPDSFYFIPSILYKLYSYTGMTAVMLVREIRGIGGSCCIAGQKREVLVFRAKFTVVSILPMYYRRHKPSGNKSINCSPFELYCFSSSSYNEMLVRVW
jgi:hypothetical protein